VGWKCPWKAGSVNYAREQRTTPYGGNNETNRPTGKSAAAGRMVPQASGWCNGERQRQVKRGVGSSAAASNQPATARQNLSNKRYRAQQEQTVGSATRRNKGNPPSTSREEGPNAAC